MLELGGHMAFESYVWRVNVCYHAHRLRLWDVPPVNANESRE